MADEMTIGERVRAALSVGALPPIYGVRTWVGLGTGHPCRVCGESIHARQVEHEVIDASPPVLLHASCLHIWRDEALGKWRRSQEGSTVARVLELILDASMCRVCIRVKLETTAEIIREALMTIALSVSLRRPSPEPCAQCASTDDVVSLGIGSASGTKLGRVK